MATKKKVTKKRPRGRSPEPYTVQELRDNGDSVLHMPKKVRVALSVGIGAAFGATVGLMFGEDPDDFIKTITDSYAEYKKTGKFTYKGQPVSVETAPNATGPTGDWLKNESHAAIVWLAIRSEFQAHAFPLRFDGPPVMSACGNVSEIDASVVKSADRGCEACVKALADSGYEPNEIWAQSRRAKAHPASSSAPPKTSKKQRARK